MFLFVWFRSQDTLPDQIHALVEQAREGIFSSITRKTMFQERIALAIAPFEFAGAALGLLFILRTNAGYDRWWEARKLCGGIVNQSRNLVIGAMAYGPNDSEWREKIVRWAAVFPHVARLNLRGELLSSEIANLVSPDDAHRIATAEHMPSFAALVLGDLLHEAREKLEKDGFAFIQVDRERGLLVGISGCASELQKPHYPGFTYDVSS